MEIHVPALQSSAADNPDCLIWETFLEAHELGQFQQSTRWARSKAAVGWEGRLVIFPSAEHLDGGFLMLVKQTRLGRIGFVNKGPVLRGESPQAVQLALEAVCRTAIQEHLQAVVLQPPDLSQISPVALTTTGFSSGAVPGVLDASAWASLQGGAEAIRARMSRTTQRECRQALSRGVQIIEGDASDLGLFFELMAHTCQRQGVQPNPPSLDALQAIWESFGSGVHLLLARVRQEIVSGLLIIRFGKRCTFWKKGWNEKFPEAHANTLLNYEGMVRACAWGCKFVDFGGMDRNLAERWLAGEPAYNDLGKTRHAFNIRLGAVPQLLPPAVLHVPNRATRILTSFLLKISKFFPLRYPMQWIDQRFSR